MTAFYPPPAINLPSNVHQERVVTWERRPALPERIQIGQLFIHAPRSVAVDPAFTALIALWRDESLTDEPITYHAFSTARELLKLLRVVFDGNPPAALLAPDSEGGIRIEWFHNNANVRAVIPREDPHAAYVYIRADGDSVVRPYSTSTIIRALRSGALNP